MKDSIRCAPVGNDGKRMKVSNQCNSRCQFYESCLKELKIEAPKFEFRELDPTEEELKVNIAHPNYKGEPKIWKLIPVRA